MLKKAYLALDLGAESGRAILVILAGDRLQLRELHRFPNTPCLLPTGLHWDVCGLWAHALEGVRRAVTVAAAEHLELVSVGVDTWGVDYGLVGRSGELLGLPYCYRDERNLPAFEKAMATLGADALYQATGIQFMALNTLFQLVAQNDSEPALLRHAERLLFMPDLLHHFFTGERVVESSIASTSQMTDPRTGRWVMPLLQRLGLPTQMLGETVPSGTPIGPLLPRVAAQVGADSSLRVIAPAAHDTASAVAAVPAGEDTSWCYISSGTWSLLGAELDRPCITAAAQAIPFTNEGGVAGTTRFLKNITGLWLVQECRRQLDHQGESFDYGTLTELAAAAESFRTLIDTAHPPFLTPGDMPAKIRAFAQVSHQPEPADPGMLVRCCLESLALAYRHTLVQMEHALGRTFDVVHIVGGGSRNRLLNQMAANAMGRRVLVGPAEATAIGNGLVQALGARHVSDTSHMRRIVRESFAPEVLEPRDAAAWDGAYRRFRDLLTETPREDP
ncbi:MAG: rhamnulokinase [Planctomycetes bacterium]|nr:rhamnulokinase [Planctomycetota bacterium]